MLISYLLLYLTLVSFSFPYLVLVSYLLYTGLFLTPLHIVLVFLPTHIPYINLFHTPPLCAGLFTYYYTLHWSLLHPSTLYWHLYLLLHLVLVYFTPLLVSLPNSILCVSSYLTPNTLHWSLSYFLPCTGLFMYSYTLCWSISHSSRSLYLILHFVLALT